MNKVCKVCKEEFDISMFYKNSGAKDGYKNQCKLCVLKQEKEYLSSEEGKKTRKIYTQSPKAKKAHSDWQKSNRKYLNEYASNKRKTDETFRLADNIRKAIRKAFYRNGLRKDAKTKDILGCSFESFRKWIERQFTDGMNWNNIHIDHYVPLSFAKTKEEIVKLNYYTNLRPMFAKDNQEKNDKLPYDLYYRLVELEII